MLSFLIHLGRVTHICVNKLTNIGSDNGLAPGRRQAIIWANAGILLIGPFGTKFSENFIEIHAFSFNKTHLNRSSDEWRPFCLGLIVFKLFSSRLLPVPPITFMQSPYDHRHILFVSIFCHTKWNIYLSYLVLSYLMTLVLSVAAFHEFYESIDELAVTLHTVYNLTAIQVNRLLTMEIGLPRVSWCPFY